MVGDRGEDGAPYRRRIEARRPWTCCRSTRSSARAASPRTTATTTAPRPGWRKQASPAGRSVCFFKTSAFVGTARYSDASPVRRVTRFLAWHYAIVRAAPRGRGPRYAWLRAGYARARSPRARARARMRRASRPQPCASCVNCGAYSARRASSSAAGMSGPRAALKIFLM